MLKNKLKSLSLFMFTILIAAALIGCGNSNTTTPAETGTSGSGEPAKHDVVTMAMTSAADTLNPYNISGNYGDVIFDQIFDHLVYVTMDGKFLPRLADSWEMSDDYTVATFKLNKM